MTETDGVVTVSASDEASFPPQHWASKVGWIDLQANGVVLESTNILDRMLIQEAFYRWGIAWDEARLDVVRSLFTMHGELVITRGSARPTSRHVGPDVIAKYVDDASRVQADQRRHAMTNVVIDRLSATEATAIAYGIVTVAANGLSLGATVIYSAELRKEADGVWRFSRFVIGMDDYAVGGAAKKAAFAKLRNGDLGEGVAPAGPASTR
ncbi:MAG: nuclear transport factor 2 family protein [Akkermansiaceae bacterium]|nr:nuclear transport factor 2 family protein [Akkermansiaceae bacterium]